MNRKVKVNMEGVESFTRCPEGEWLARLKKVDMGEVQGSGDDCLKAQFEVIKGSAKGSIIFETFSLTEKALWKLKSFLDAAGMKSNGKLVLDLDKMEGKVCIIDVIHDEYNGQKRAKISSYIKPGEDEDDEDEVIDDEDIEDEDDEEEETPKKPAKKSTAKAAPAKKPKQRPEPEEDDEDEDEDDDEEDDEPPVKSKTGKKAAPAKSSKKSSAKPKKPSEDEDDEDDDWEEDDD